MKSPPEQVDVTIAGGGLVGATLGLMLATAAPELKVHIIEAQSLDSGGEALPSFDERTSAISPSSKEVFDRLGLWAGLVPYASSITHIQVSDRGHLGAARLGPEDNAGEPLGYVVKNRGLGKVLTAALRASSVKLFAPAKVTDIRPVARGMSVRIDAGQPITTRLLVLADGADSPLCRQLGIAQQRHDYQQFALVSSVRHSKAHAGTAYESFHRDGPLAMLPLADCNGCASGVVWTLPEAQLDLFKNMTDSELLARLQRQFGFALGEFQQLGPRQCYPLSLQLAKEQVRSHLVLMGNAAHFLHPVAGQGFNLAMRDMLRLVEAIKHVPVTQIGHLATLSNYVKGQAKDQTNTTFLSHNFSRWFSYTWPGAAMLRSLGFAVLETSPGLRRELILQMSGRASPKAHPWGNKAYERSKSQ